MSMKWWTGNLFKRSFVVALSLSIILTSGCSLLPSEGEEEVLPEINPPAIAKRPEYTVSTDTLETKVQVMGKLISLEEETMFFTSENKHLKELYVKTGDVVQAGDLIAELDVDDLEKTLRNERLSFKREETLMKETLRTRDEMDPIDFEEKRIAFEERRQKLLDLEEEISKAQLYAPFSGTIVSVDVQKGALIKAYQSIAIVADTSLIVPAAKLTKNELEKVAVGMEAVVTMSNIGKFKGKIKTLPAPKTEQNNNGNPNENNKPERPEDFMIIDIAELPKEVNRGMPLSIDIITKRTENAIVIPPSTLRTIGSRTYVQVIENDVKREVDVEVGQQTPTQVEILKGLEPGQKVVGR
ncbi:MULTISPECIES: efflux RND transporter periplasmic adaptor subunit [unclassified Paenibacillus]|uniref:efflux RND transporter periplasmic adaptor subunit n=1 Tax=unclassified Paenibacillus TaxID=185978 RepID=UPI002F3FC0C9